MRSFVVNKVGVAAWGAVLKLPWSCQWVAANGAPTPDISMVMGIVQLGDYSTTNPDAEDCQDDESCP